MGPLPRLLARPALGLEHCLAAPCMLAVAVYKIADDSPRIGIDWGIGQPIVSERDAESLRLKDIDPANLPK